MGKKKRIKESKSKKLLDQLTVLNREIARNEHELAKLESAKSEMLAGMLTENSGDRSMRLGDILNDAQMQAVVDILNRTNLTDIQQTKLLKQYLAQFSKQLNAIGVLPDYLAYVLLANADAIRAMAKASNNPPADPFQPGPNAHN